MESNKCGALEANCKAMTLQTTSDVTMTSVDGARNNNALRVKRERPWVGGTLQKPSNYLKKL